MEHTFVTVVLAVGVIGVLGAVFALLGSRDPWRALGRDGLVKDSDGKQPPPPALPRSAGSGPSPRGRQLGGIERAPLSAPAEREEDIRQMLEARNHRRARRGLPALDVESEIARQIADLNG